MLATWTALLAASLASSIPAGTGEPPNVLIVLMDDVGRDKVAVYADHPAPAPTPNLDSLAASGVLFRNAWAYPTCSPTRAALLTGRHSDRTGIGSIVRPGDGVDTPLALSETILPEILPDHSRAMLGKWHLADAGDPLTHPNLSGFDLTLGQVGQVDYFSWSMHLNGNAWQESGYYTSALTRRAVDVLGRLPEPWFVYHCPFAAHPPFHVPPQQLHTQGHPSSRPGMHRAMVEALDRHIGVLLRSVDLSTTFVFVVGDNGSPGNGVAPPWDRQRSKRSPYESGVRVPFIAAGPGVAAGVECDELVHVTDLFATIAEIVGQPVPEGTAQDSVSFAGLLRNPLGQGVRDHLYVHQFPHAGAQADVPSCRAIRTKRWKLIEWTTTQQIELYDLVSDPTETNDLLAAGATGAAATRDRLLALMPTFP